MDGFLNRPAGYRPSAAWNGISASCQVKISFKKVKKMTTNTQNNSRETQNNYNETKTQISKKFQIFPENQRPQRD